MLFVEEVRAFQRCTNPWKSDVLWNRKISFSTIEDTADLVLVQLNLHQISTKSESRVQVGEPGAAPSLLWAAIPIRLEQHSVDGCCVHHATNMAFILVSKRLSFAPCVLFLSPVEPLGYLSLERASIPRNGRLPFPKSP